MLYLLLTRVVVILYHVWVDSAKETKTQTAIPAHIQWVSRSILGCRTVIQLTEQAVCGQLKPEECVPPDHVLAEGSGVSRIVD